MRVVRLQNAANGPLAVQLAGAKTWNEKVKAEVTKQIKADKAQIKADKAALNERAAALRNLLDMPPKAGGGKSDGHNMMRRVLISLGWLDDTLYSESDIGYASGPAILRLQAALGVKMDGYWGKGTTKVFAAAIGADPARAQAVLYNPNVTYGGAPSSPPREPRRPDLPREPPPPEIAKAGFPWPLAVGLLVVGGVITAISYFGGKKRGLAGCELHDHNAMAGSEDDGEGDEGSDPYGHIPEFMQLVAQSQNGGDELNLGDDAATNAVA